MAQEKILFASAVALMLCVTASGVTLTSLKPAAMTVKINDFMIDGTMVPVTTPFNDSAVLNAPGIPTLEADRDEIMISYSTKEGAAINGTVTAVNLRLCFAKPSQFDRAWRKADDNLAKSKDCQNVIKLGLPPPSGSYTYKIPDSVADGVFYVRAYSVCSPPGAPLVQCAFGNSPGYFQINKINDRPPSLIGATIGCCFFGPVCLTAYFLYDKYVKKHV